MTADDAPDFNVDRLLEALRRGVWLIIACALVTTAAALGISKLEGKRYAATTSLLFQNQDTIQGEAGLPESGAIDPNGPATNVALVAGSQVAQSTARAVGHGLSAQDVRDAISVGELGQTDIVTVQATSRVPALAAAIANTYAKQFIDARRTQQQASVRSAITSLQQQIAHLPPAARSGAQGQAGEARLASLQTLQSLENGGATIVAPAAAPTSPSSPKLHRNVLIGLVLGLLLGVLIAIIVERSTRRVGADDVASTFALPLLATVGAGERDRWPAPANGHHPPSNGAGEAFRLLRARLRYFNIERDVTTVLITSPAAGDGRTSVATHLATTAAGMGTKVLLIEADLRHPSLHRVLGVEARPGLADLLSRGHLDYQDVIQSLGADGDTRSPDRSARNGGPLSHAADTSARPHQTPLVDAASTVRRLDVIAAGASPANAAVLLESPAMRDLLAWARASYDLVVIDTPPPSLYADAIPLIRRVDGVIIVCRLGSTTQAESETLRTQLESLGAPVLGVVANAGARRLTARRRPRAPR
jgi:Mrp family chromosome partitioning ATPase/capsular polysaccharide biosynthesis protein